MLEETGSETIALAQGNDGLLTLTQELAGVYQGFRHFKDELINCPNCEFPCNFTYAYDTAFVDLTVVSYSEDSITIIDNYDDEASRTFGIDSNLTYFGGPQGYFDAPDGHYWVWFKGETNDSLIVHMVAGGGEPGCYGSYHYHDYALVKQ